MIRPMMDAQQHYYLQQLGIQTWIPRTSHPWKTFATTVSQCTRCPLSQTRTQAVLGVGDVDADILIIGEAPDDEADQQGEPFVGRAGQLLNAMLASLGLNREAVYITNLLKCRPPENRASQPEEVRQCAQYLEQQINWVQPKLILVLGHHAAHYLLKTDQPMAKLRGQNHVYGDTNIPVLVTHHPAYLLQNAGMKKQALLDLASIQTM